MALIYSLSKLPGTPALFWLCVVGADGNDPPSATSPFLTGDHSDTRPTPVGS